MRQRQAVDVSGPVNFNDALKNAGIDGDYSDYLKTQHWTRVRRRTLARRKNCVACNGDGNGQPMHVHHQTYRRLGRELSRPAV